jgi:hypothetical protein
MPLNKDLREFLGLLNSNEVEYLVVGAFAVAFHAPQLAGAENIWFTRAGRGRFYSVVNLAALAGHPPKIRRGQRLI